MAVENVRRGEGPLSTREYVRFRRIDAGLTVEEVAARADVSAEWLMAFEAGSGAEELMYERLVALIRATQPERPEWWDDGHEHDLHLGRAGAPPVPDARARYYWERIEAVRDANRSGRSHA